jgi:hypothetical protein
LSKFSCRIKIIRTGSYGRKTPFYFFEDKKIIYNAIDVLKNDIFLNLILSKESSQIYAYLHNKGFIYISKDDGGEIFCHIDYPDSYFNLEYNELNRCPLYDKFWCKTKIDTALNSVKRKQKISKLLGV